jgi:hypothetical protein
MNDRKLVVLLAALALMLLGPSPASADPVLGTDFEIGANFTDSVMFEAGPGFIPPDTMGAVGPDHIAVLINGAFAVYDKTGTQLELRSLDSFWAQAGATPNDFSFDPRILYDPHHNRWFASSADNSGGGSNNFLVAVSGGTDPRTTGAGWTGFQIDSDTDDAERADFPMMGMNDDVVVVSANMFPTGAGSVNKTFLVLPKDDLLLGSPSIANRTLIENVDPNDTGFSCQPIVDLDNGSVPLPLLSAFNKPAGALARQNINGPVNSPSLDGSPTLIGVTGRSGPGDVGQAPPVTVDVDAADNRFTGNVILQNGSIWGAHSVEFNGRAAIEWYEIRQSDNTVLQSGLITPSDMPAGMQDPDLEFNFPSISVNDSGDVVIGFSGGSPNTNPETGISWWMSTFLAVGETVGGVTTFSDIVMTQSGLAPYERLDGSGRNRWGDYSATVLDPADPSGKTFWTFQEFTSSEDIWAVKVTEVRITDAALIPEPAAVSLLGLALLGLRRRRS